MVLAACVPPPQGAQPQESQRAASTSLAAAGRPLIAGLRYEVNDLAPKRTGGASSTFTKRVFNASLALTDGTGAPRPYLAEELPDLNTASWQVSPDGRMVTTYRLKPDLTWHDGAPLTAQDFVFALQVYSARGLGSVFTSKPQDQIDEIVAPDSRTVVVRWRSLYPGAGALTSGLLEPLPEHILGRSLGAFEQDPTTMDAFLALPFWTTEYVGLGPYKVESWQPGSSLSGTAFAGHALGQPKIDQIVIRFIPDENVIMTNLLAGSIDLAGNGSIRYEQAKVLRQRWEADHAGSVVVQPGSRHWIFVQFREDLLQAKGLADIRVRRALASAVDRASVNEALFDGQGFMTDSFVPLQAPYAARVEQAIRHYPFDPGQAARFMSEAGFAKDADGFFADGAGMRFRPQYLADGSATFLRERDVIQNGLVGAGIAIDPQTLPGNIANMNEYRTTFPDLYASSTGSQETQLDIFSSAQIATAEKRWAGNNRGGWVNEEYDRWWTAFNTTLDRPERDQQLVEMMKVLAQEVPGVMIYFNMDPVAYLAPLQGPEQEIPETLANWNLSDWQWR